MWRSLWRSIDRFSLQYFKYVINELREIKVVHKANRESVVDILQSIVEIVTYGDRHDPAIFECFMEYQVLAEFVRLLKISRNSRIEAPLLQYLSIMIQNMDSEHAIYYCFSNDYINSIITHQYEFDGGDLAPYYVSFLRAVSSKLNRDTLCLLVKVHEDVVVAFPLYSEALKFAYHGEKMIQIAVRALTLNIYNVSDAMVYQFVTSPPVSEYFSDLVQSLREQCFHLDALVHDKEETSFPEKEKELRMATDKIVDDLYYFKDILCVGESRLSGLVAQNLLSLLIFPVFFPLLQLRKCSGSDLSAVTCLYVISRLLQVVGGKSVVNSVAGIILYPFMTSSMRDTTRGDSGNGSFQDKSFVTHLNKLEMQCSGLESEGAENIERNCLFGHLLDYISSNSHFVSCPWDNKLGERSGLLSYIFSDNHSLVLASLFFLLVLGGSKDLDYLLASTIGFSETKTGRQKTIDISASQLVDGSVFVKYVPQILNALLKVLASQPPFSVQFQWHTGWFLQKLLAFQEEKLVDNDFHLFNTSYEQSCERLRKEIDGCWFDFIPDTLRNEWASYKRALAEPSLSKDPFFTLVLAVHKETVGGDRASSYAWRRMVDTVKVFIVHLHLKAFIFKGEPLEDLPINLMSSSVANSGKNHPSDISTASFGSELALGSGIPCKIAFSKVGTRDIYLKPVGRGISGKLLLMEKHPFKTRQGVVIAIAPLAGLSPKRDESQPTWLHLRIREFEPRFDTSKTIGKYSIASNHVADGRWTLGFSSAEACEAARLLILEEIQKQRYSVESLLAPLLRSSSRGDLSDSQGE